MVTYLAVVFFCFQEQCYFYNGTKQHFTLEACVAEVEGVESNLEKDGIDSRSTCIKLNSNAREA